MCELALIETGRAGRVVLVGLDCRDFRDLLGDLLLLAPYRRALSRWG